MPKYIFNSERDDYLTPSEFYEEVLKNENMTTFQCDVCCTQFNIPAFYHYTVEGLYLLDGKKVSNNDGLTGDWFLTNWCNPPFGRCDEFVEKAVTEQKKGNTTYMLIPARIETAYWHKYILDENGGTNRKDVEVRFLRKGLCFLHPETGLPVPQKVKTKDGYKLVDGVYKNALALVIFRGANNG